jgi:DNA-directed RNA polymerase specialized sigma24 family protein
MRGRTTLSHSFATDQTPPGRGDGEEREVIPLRNQLCGEASRPAVYYADVEGLSDREIADTGHTPVGTVVSRLHRRRRLRTTLLSVARQRGYGTAVSA